MKKPLVYIAALAMLLTGCSAETPPADPAGNQAAEESAPAESLQEGSGESEAYKLSLDFYGEGEDNMVEFTSTDLEGSDVNSGELFASAQVTMLNIWGTYCSPCLMEMPDLGELAREYADRGVQIVGVVCDIYSPDGADEAKSLAEETGADYTHLIASDSVLEEVMMKYSVSAVPTTFFLDSEGRMICPPVVGSKEKATWAGALDDILAQ